LSGRSMPNQPFFSFGSSRPPSAGEALPLKLVLLEAGKELAELIAVFRRFEIDLQLLGDALSAGGKIGERQIPVALAVGLQSSFHVRNLQLGRVHQAATHASHRPCLLSARAPLLRPRSGHAVRLSPIGSREIDISLTLPRRCVRSLGRRALLSPVRCPTRLVRNATDRFRSGHATGDVFVRRGVLRSKNRADGGSPLEPGRST
jgi:hypothetical protein